jgi:Ca2+/Na+ antiporter
MKKNKILLIILIFTITVTIITLLSFHIELLQNSTVKILLSLCTVLGLLLGRLLDNDYNQREKEEREEMTKEVEEIGKE